MISAAERDRQARAEKAAALEHFKTHWQCRRKGDHRHTLNRLIAGPPMRDGSPRRRSLVDRCNSALLWSNVAYAILEDKDPRLDGKPFTKWSKVDAWNYLLTLPVSYRRGIFRRIAPPEETR